VSLAARFLATISQSQKTTLITENSVDLNNLTLLFNQLRTENPKMIGNKQLSLLCLFLLLASVAIAAPKKENVRSLQKNYPTEYDTTLRMLKPKAKASGNEEDDESEKEKIVHGAGTTGVDKDISESDEDDDISESDEDDDISESDEDDDISESDEDDDIEPSAPSVSAPSSSPSMKKKSKKNGTTDSNTLSPEEPKSTKKGKLTQSTNISMDIITSHQLFLVKCRVH
jgi:hypothetical protein